MSPRGLLLLLLLALAPALARELPRVATPTPEEPWHFLLALASAAGMLAVLGHRRPLPPERRGLGLAGLTFCAYLVSWLLAPSLVVAALGLATLGFLVSALFLGGHAPVGLAGLLVLGLRIVPTLQEHLGPPLQDLGAALAGQGLAALGVAVQRHGATLNWQDQAVFVAPGCCGLRMLWAGLYLALLCLCLRRLSPLRSLALLAAAAALLVAANVVRIMVLFGTAVGLLGLPGWAHGPVGLGIFAAAAGLVVLAASRLETPG